jgi:hypothetical protein
MSDQKKGAGHHAVTREAVHELFGARAQDGKIDGLSEDEYFQRLDQAQEYVDRTPLDTLRHGESPGDTWIPGKWVPDAQRKHSVADPNKDGAHNLADNVTHIVSELDEAKQARFNGQTDPSDHQSEMAHLGAAAHALEDSYSNAHAFRGAGVNAGDWHAPVESYNVFDPADRQSVSSVEDGAVAGGVAGAALGTVLGPAGTVIGGALGALGGAAYAWYENNQHHHDGEGTHDDRFDDVPVAQTARHDAAGIALNPDGSVPLLHGSDQAAAHATAEMLIAYVDHESATADQADRAFAGTIGADFQPASGGVRVNEDNTDPAWQAERDQRLDEQGATSHALTGTDIPDFAEP